MGMQCKIAVIYYYFIHYPLLMYGITYKVIQCVCVLGVDYKTRYHELGHGIVFQALLTILPPKEKDIQKYRIYHDLWLDTIAKFMIFRSFSQHLIVCTKVVVTSYLRSRNEFKLFPANI